MSLFQLAPAVLAALSLAADPKTPPPAPAAPAPVISCQDAEQRIGRASGKLRDDLVGAAIDLHCEPLPPIVQKAIFDGKWGDKSAVAIESRAAYLGRAIRARYPAAESLAVTLITNGQWPGGPALDAAHADHCILALKGSLTPYRIGLLLDVYDQVHGVETRSAVLSTLCGAKGPEALLPALDAYLRLDGALKQSAKACLDAEPEHDPVLVLARVVREVKASCLPWAAELTKGQQSPAILQAKKARGL